MINVAVVDNEADILEKVRCCVEQVEGLEDEVSIQTFFSAEDFLKQEVPGKRWDIVFSDIRMDGMDGIAFAALLYKKYPHLYLAFLTSFSEYAVKSYEMDVSQYILKQQMGERIPKVLRQAIHKIVSERERFLIVETGAGNRKINYEDIVCINKQKNSKYVVYVTLDGDFRARETLNTAMEELKGPEFLMIDRSYIINICHIKGLHSNSIYLTNGDRMDISRGRLKEVKEKINRYWGNVE